MKEKLPIEKLLNIETKQYKIAIATFKRVYQIAENDKIRNMVSDSKRIPIVALSDILTNKVKIMLNNEEQHLIPD